MTLSKTAMYWSVKSIAYSHEEFFFLSKDTGELRFIILRRRKGKNSLKVQEKHYSTEISMYWSVKSMAYSHEEFFSRKRQDNCASLY
jgi:hypothetical protein